VSYTNRDAEVERIAQAIQGYSAALPRKTKEVIFQNMAKSLIAIDAIGQKERLVTWIIAKLTADDAVIFHELLRTCEFLLVQPLTAEMQPVFFDYMRISLRQAQGALHENERIAFSELTKRVAESPIPHQDPKTGFLDWLRG
jgi:hypothetical protein